jgi:hypothetical protein
MTNSPSIQPGAQTEIDQTLILIVHLLQQVRDRRAAQQQRVPPEKPDPGTSIQPHHC